MVNWRRRQRLRRPPLKIHRQLDEPHAQIAVAVRYARYQPGIWYLAPWSAASVFVDGNYAGTVSYWSQPVTQRVRVGRHAIEVRGAMRDGDVSTERTLYAVDLKARTRSTIYLGIHPPKLPFFAPYVLAGELDEARIRRGPVRSWLRRLQRKEILFHHALRRSRR